MSSCSEDHAEANLNIKSWIDFKSSKDNDLLNALPKSTQGIEQLQNEYMEQEQAIKSFL